ncbi:hypothetical protein [Marinomonas posidonica]|uniref:hypothetical protein n=1 Tax=Marinomonas posidonica TaxID=936476 RepID=UPI003735BAFE
MKILYFKGQYSEDPLTKPSGSVTSDFHFWALFKRKNFEWIIYDESLEVLNVMMSEGRSWTTFQDACNLKEYAHDVGYHQEYSHLMEEIEFLGSTYGDEHNHFFLNLDTEWGKLLSYLVDNRQPAINKLKSSFNDWCVHKIA